MIRLRTDAGWLTDHIQEALEEDHASRDATTRQLEEPQTEVNASLISREQGILAGLDVFRKTFKTLASMQNQSDNVTFDAKHQDGDSVEKSESIGTINGPANLVLPAERVALNYLQQMSGMATVTNELVQIAAPHDIRVLDTRKTVPHYRKFQKYAVGVGGGENHRMNLEEAIMVKDNHKIISGGLDSYLRGLRTDKPVVVEIHDQSELDTLIELDSNDSDIFDIDIIMLDNFTCDAVKKAVGTTPDRYKLEISGGITRENIESYCKTGVDQISVGALTHSFRSLDLSLKLSP